ncbi:hypothetical protein F4859DRAFT_517495 [Xylaria cf. heliscus]|nr:hypothetical protein F4859DRAFT_517495 [Xylaria cf. heliscus]
MSSSDECYNCVKKPSSKAGKAKAAIRALLQSKPTTTPSVNGRPTLCRECKAAAKRYGNIFNDPLRCHVPYNAPSSQRDEKGPCKEINRYIWGDKDTTTGSEDDEEMLVNRVYSMLRLENSPVLEYLEQNGCDLSRLPSDARRKFERVIRRQIYEQLDR